MRPIATAGSAARLWLCAAIAAGLGGAPPAAAQQLFPREVIEPQIPERPESLAPEAPALVPERARPEPAPAPAGPSFVLQGVEFRGSSVYDAARLEALVADRIGEPVDFAGLKAIADRVEALYAEDGYLAVRAVIPAQRIAGGRVRVEIVEAAIAEVVIRGDLGRAEPAVRQSLETLVGRRPLQGAEAERALLLARDLPGVNLIAALRARRSETPGELVLLVEGTQAAVDGFFSLSNFASEFAGPVVATAGAAVNSALLSGDRFEVVGLASLDVGEQALAQLSYDAPTGIEGLRLSLRGSATYSATGGPLEDLGIDYRSQVVRAGADYTILRSRARTLTASGGFEWIHQDSDARFDPIEIEEDLRVFYAGLRLVESDLGGGLLDARGDLRLGVEALGASADGDPGLSRGGSADPSFVSAAAEASYRRALPAGLSLRARVSGQVSSGRLPSFETFSLGSYTIGRGFDPGTLTGDHGLGASLELAYALPIPTYDAFASPSAFGFVDTGRVWNEDGPDAGLTSLGAGLRWQLFERVDAELMVAVPVQSADFVDEDSVKGLFRLTTFF